MKATLESHRLYEEAVQSPENEIALFERIFAERFGKEPVSLREDFCGTALLCRHWVESDADRVARGVDLDAEVLTAAHTLNREPLDEDEAERFELEHADARDLSDRTFDIITAGNYSWALFDEAALSRYLASARHCLEDEGMLALELFGGADLTRPLVQEHAGAGFTYVWEQTHYDPASRRLDAAIHFRLDSGRVLRDAFRYRFTLRGWPETKAAMRASGFTGVRLWVESPSGGFSKRHTSPDAAVWGGYAVGFNGPSR